MERKRGGGTPAPETGGEGGGGVEVSPPEPWGKGKGGGGGAIRGGVSVIDTARPAPPQSHQQYKTRPNVDIITGNFADVDLHETFSIKTHTQDKPQTDQVPLKRRFWIAPLFNLTTSSSPRRDPPPLCTEDSPTSGSILPPKVSCQPPSSSLLLPVCIEIGQRLFIDEPIDGNKGHSPLNLFRPSICDPSPLNQGHLAFLLPRTPHTMPAKKRCQAKFLVTSPPLPSATQQPVPVKPSSPQQATELKDLPATEGSKTEIRCDKAAVRVVGECGYCAGSFCAAHRLPEQHFW